MFLLFSIFKAINSEIDLLDAQYVNRNESFINTASKLLEKVKQQNSSLSSSTTTSSFTSSPTKHANIELLPSKTNLNNLTKKRASQHY